MLMKKTIKNILNTRKGKITEKKCIFFQRKTFLQPKEGKH